MTAKATSRAAKTMQPEAGAKTYLDPAAQKALADRLARLEGHVRAVRRMVLERRCADEIVLQVAACKAALSRFTSALMDHELKACMQSCMGDDAEERAERLARALSTVLKQG